MRRELFAWPPVSYLRFRTCTFEPTGRSPCGGTIDDRGSQQEPLDDAITSPFFAVLYGWSSESKKKRGIIRRRLESSLKRRDSFLQMMSIALAQDLAVGRAVAGDSGRGGGGGGVVGNHSPGSQLKLICCLENRLSGCIRKGCRGAIPYWNLAPLCRSQPHPGLSCNLDLRFPHDRVLFSCKVVQREWCTYSVQTRPCSGAIRSWISKETGAQGYRFTRQFREDICPKTTLIRNRFFTTARGLITSGRGHDRSRAA